MYRTIEWTSDGVSLIDQRLLPGREVYIICRTHVEVARAITDMIIRGAPAIGVAAAMGVALGVREIPAGASREEMDAAFTEICRCLAASRPTAVNLFWAIQRMKGCYQALAGKPLMEIHRKLEQEALAVHREDVESCQRIGHFGQLLIPNNATFLTHCNAGGLATGGYGTALGVIRAAHEYGKKVRVFADETRPFLQGARLTAWELQQLGIPVTVITDNMSGHIMAQGLIDAVVVGADRIAANGDTANKIGTYMVAVLAREHALPFYVAAPLSTIDFEIDSGHQIPIEERSAREVTHIAGTQLTPDGVGVRNPAFDVTPAHLVTAIITDRGIARPPYPESLAKFKSMVTGS
jgi:methylthioribose-1-phosphate isomerase